MIFKRMSAFWWMLLFVLSSTGCQEGFVPLTLGDTTNTVENSEVNPDFDGTDDAGTPGTGAPDSGSPDTGEPDANVPDTGEPDPDPRVEPPPRVGDVVFLSSGGGKATSANYQLVVGIGQLPAGQLESANYRVNVSVGTPAGN